MPRRLRTLTEILVSDIVSKSKKYVPYLSREEIITLFELDKITEEAPASCGYCKKILKHKSQTSRPWKDVPSIDHMRPHTMDGDSLPDNLKLVCHECNIIKSTSDFKTFTQLLELLNKSGKEDLKDNYFTQMWRGKFANKVERVEMKRRQIACLSNPIIYPN